MGTISTSSRAWDHGFGHVIQKIIIGSTKQIRLTRQNWLEIGLQAMSDVGPDGLTIDAICKRANKTRGSFYHHFKSTDDYIAALLDWWKQTFTINIIEKTETRTQTSDKHDHLNNLAAHLDPRAEQAFRRLAARNEKAQLVVREVDQARLAYLTSLFAQSSRYSNDQAKMIAKIEYAAWVGFQLIEPDATPAQMLDMYQGFLQLTGRA